jgi:hypothetical protein
MPDAIKLNVLDAIESEIRSVSGIKSVLINPPERISIEISLIPVVVVWDEDEDMEQHNRIEMGVFPLHMQVWVHGKLYGRSAENYRASIKSKLYSSVALDGLGAVYLEEKASKFYHNKLTGGIDTMGNVTYRTNALDATTQSY